MLRNLIIGALVLFMLVTLSACSRLNFGSTRVDEPQTAEPSIVAVPTFTPTPTLPPTPESSTLALPESDVESTSETPAEAMPQANADDTDPMETASALTQAEGQELDRPDAASAPSPEDGGADNTELSVLLAPTPTPEPSPRVVVTTAGINLRRGPGTIYEQVGAAVQGDTLAVIGRNPAGDWWQVCCVTGDQPAWVYAPLVQALNTDAIAIAAEIPPPPAAPVVEPVALPPEPQPAPPTTEPASEPLTEAAPEPVVGAAPPGQPAPTSGTAGNFDPNAQYQIVHYRTLGFHDNNGGIFNKGGQQLIFLVVLDQNGNGLDGVVVKNANADNLTVITGDKGPGKAEIKMDSDPYKLYVAQDGSGPVTSHVSNQMNNPYPHIPDIVGLMGPVDLEYAICPAIDDRCDPPFYHAHWSYEITFQKVR